MVCLHGFLPCLPDNLDLNWISPNIVRFPSCELIQGTWLGTTNLPNSICWSQQNALSASVNFQSANGGRVKWRQDQFCDSLILFPPSPEFILAKNVAAVYCYSMVISTNKFCKICVPIFCRYLNLKLFSDLHRGNVRGWIMKALKDLQFIW